jgi:hypothetical protein
MLEQANGGLVEKKLMTRGSCSASQRLGWGRKQNVWHVKESPAQGITQVDACHHRNLIT